jgi:hypothetical protein
MATQPLTPEAPLSDEAILRPPLEAMVARPLAMPTLPPKEVLLLDPALR